MLIGIKLADPWQNRYKKRNAGGLSEWRCDPEAFKKSASACALRSYSLFNNG
jgi:hypothetical protein